jgi:hypothetical protein
MSRSYFRSTANDRFLTLVGSEAADIDRQASYRYDIGWTRWTIIQTLLTRSVRGLAGQVTLCHPQNWRRHASAHPSWPAVEAAAQAQKGATDRIYSVVKGDVTSLPLTNLNTRNERRIDILRGRLGLYGSSFALIARSGNSGVMVLSRLAHIGKVG